ncbi:ATP-binding protein [Arenibacter sp. BSSL-BM3]|uniref:ATP-binding protein n=1 Tax=Arenibacter arenosicollis TaxID=2762274 RepID=A0ABR7QQQ4_9FLAO|nr:ATP-binding protein [Arenibacter arenosicollis]MBC8769409.1 ATP-binding protein [Arenibacter arenosicollis]
MAKFKARARALDLLGRQQIAGVPTAINELFKNAHDAYADNVEIDYFRKQKLMVLRDNGLGMTKDDFESRWLTLGTESKFANKKIPLPPIDPKKTLRPIMGEKGIGRLAIASIGSQVLIISKAKRTEKEHKIVAAFINWSIFELPGLNLDDVIVPIREYDDLPTKEEIEQLKKELLDSLEKLAKLDEINQADANSIINTVKSFDVSPKDLNQTLIGNFAFSKNQGGTQFYIDPVDETLNHFIDGDKNNSDATKIEKMLVGFTNTMTPNHPEPLINLEFRDYRNNDGTYLNILDKEQFFTPKDFDLADHHFQGIFDEFGQFSGSIKIYREKSFEHKIIWNGNYFKPTECGEFSINLAYVQGRLKQSIIDSENYARITAKADKFGGIYIYRDNIRMLPYGDSDYDFIDIERNRTKSASFYFFSYRRMFGVVNISRADNYKLTEKAGREGFIENKAYRQLQDILKNFFLQLAADFFREGSNSPKTEFWAQKRAERESYYKALERRDQQAKVRKERFQQNLNSFFEDLNSNKFKSELETLLESQEKKFGSLASIDDPEQASQSLINCELEARKEIEAYKQKIKVPQPKGFTISRDTRKDYEAYIDELKKLETGIFLNAVDNIDIYVDDYTERLNIEISKRKRLEQAVDFISIEAKKAASGKQKETKKAVSEITSKVKELTTELMIELDNQIRDVKDRFKTLGVESSEDFDLVNERKSMEADINRGRERVTGVLERVIKQLQGIYWDRDLNQDIVTSDEIADAMAEELDELKGRIHADIELSQLGLAVGVIHHEFNSTTKSIRHSIKDLKAWADVNENLESVYNNIKINFEHLDGYLNLFTPLNRRLNRKREEISALEIKTFLIDLFKPRLERHNIQFKHTKGFAKKKIHGFRSTFYPVFVNVVDNAIHWLNQANVDEKIIRLHADDTGIYMSNNGPEVTIQDKNRIFELGFTRKSNGRGMGLHISREVLNAENYNIFLDTSRKGETVSFKIEPIKQLDNE